MPKTFIVQTVIGNMDSEHVKNSIRAARTLVVLVAFGVFGSIVLTVVTNGENPTSLFVFWTMMFAAMIYTVWETISS